MRPSSERGRSGGKSWRSRLVELARVLVRVDYFVLAVWRIKEAECGPPVNDWELIADNLSKAGCSWGCVSALDREGRRIWIVDAHRDDGKRFIVRADEKLSAFLELERAVCIHLLTQQN